MRKTEIERAKERLYQYFKESPALSKMLSAFPRLTLQPLFLTKKMGKKWQYLWEGHNKVISVSMKRKTLDMLPKDPREQKFLFSHELGHLQESPQEQKKYRDCKIHQQISTFEAGNCLFAEAMASQRGYEILKKLNLLSPDEENAFWEWELELENEEPDLAECRKALKTKTCPLQKELSAMLRKLRQLSSS